MGMVAAGSPGSKKKMDGGLVKPVMASIDAIGAPILNDWETMRMRPVCRTDW